MDFNAFKEIVIAQCAALGIQDYELYYEQGTSTSVEAFQHELNEFSSSQDGGLCFRCISGGRMGYASTQALTEEEARKVVLAAVDNASVLETEDPIFLGEGGQVYEPLPERGYPLPSTEEMISTVLSCQDLLYAADPAVIDGSQSQAISESSEICIYNSRGLDLHYSNQLSGLLSVAVVSDGKEMANDYQIKLGKISDIDKEALTKKAAATAIRKLGGDPAPTGQYPVVFDSEAMSDLLATFSGIFSSEAAQKGLSKFADQEGKTVASPLVTLVDDPFHPENPMPMNFDAEGSPAHRKAIIEKGVLSTLLYNLKTAAKAGKKTTGNASKGGYDAAVGIRPFSMVLEGGEKSEEALLKEVGEGVYINSLNGLHAGADPITGDFSLQSAGFMIEKGRKTRAVKSFTVAGNFYQLLKDIVAVADNSHLPSPMGHTAFGAPTTVVKGLSIAGK